MSFSGILLDPMLGSPPPQGRRASELLWRANTLTHPQVVHLLAHAAVLFRDLLEVLVEARLERDEGRQGGEVGLWGEEVVSGYS